MAWVGAAASIAGSLISSSMAGDASDKQSGATAGAIAEQQRQYDQTRSDMAPWRNQGTAAINRLGTLLGLGGPTSVGTNGKQYTLDDFRDYNRRAAPRGYAGGDADAQTQFAQYMAGTLGGGGKDDAWVGKELGFAPRADPNDPAFGSLTKKFTLADFWDDPVTKASYQQGLDQGTKALNNSAARAGSLNSGAQLKALARFGTDYTGNQAGQSQARYVNDQTNLYNRLAGIAGTGQNAANTVAASGTNTANTIGGLLTAQGNARGAASIAGGNAISGGLSNAANNYQQQNTLDRLLGRTGGYVPPVYGVGGGQGGDGQAWWD